MFHVKRNQTLDPSNFGEQINKTNALLRMLNQHLHNTRASAVHLPVVIGAL